MTQGNKENKYLLFSATYGKAQPVSMQQKEVKTVMCLILDQLHS